MKIKAFSFEKDSFSLASLKQEITSAVNESGIYFESFNEPNELFKNISSALENTEALLLGVEPAFFLKFKQILIKAFAFTPAYSEKIDETIGSAIADDKLRKAHSLVPNECVELISEDGLYSGFYVKSADQYIVVFPLMENVSPAILIDSDLPFFKSDETKETAFADIANSEKASVKASNIVAKLLKNDIKLAIPSTPAAKLFKEDIKGCKNYENNIFFTPFVNDDGASDLKEYAAQLSKGSMDLRNADLGASITNVFRERNGEEIICYYTFISVATAEKIIVKKLFATPEEKVENLLIEATNELYSLIDKYADEIVFKRNASEEEIKKYEASLIEAEINAARPVASVSKAGTIAAIITLIAAVVICIILGFKFGGYFVSSDDAPEESSLQSGGVINSTTLPQNTQGIPEYSGSVTEPESTTSSIFEVPSNGNSTPTINYTPNTNNQQPNTQAPPTQEPETQAPPTQAPETQAPAPSTTEETIPEIIM